jgi:hypothetical protein
MVGTFSNVLLDSTPGPGRPVTGALPVDEHIHIVSVLSHLSNILFYNFLLEINLKMRYILLSRRNRR